MLTVFPIYNSNVICYTKYNHLSDKFCKSKPNNVLWCKLHS